MSSPSRFLSNGYCVPPFHRVKLRETPFLQISLSFYGPIFPSNQHFTVSFCIHSRETTATVLCNKIFRVCYTTPRGGDYLSYQYDCTGILDDYPVDWGNLHKKTGHAPCRSWVHAATCHQMQGRETAKQITGTITTPDLWQLLTVVFKKTGCFLSTCFYAAYNFQHL